MTRLRLQLPVSALLAAFGAFVVAGCQRTVPQPDAGRADGGAGDAGSPMGVDAGSPGTDAGSPGTDAGGPEADAGGPGTDAGAPGTDAGVPDAGAPETDAGPEFCPGGVAADDSNLRINEVHAAPNADDDVNCDGVFDGQYEEFVEIVNPTATPVDARGVALEYNGATELMLDACVPAHGAVIVYRSTRISSTSCALGSSVIPLYGGLNLSNAGGTVSLVDASATPLDSVTYPDLGAEASRPSYVRDPDYTGGSFVLHTTADTDDGSTFSAGTCTDGTLFPSCAP